MAQPRRNFLRERMWADGVSLLDVRVNLNSQLALLKDRPSDPVPVSQSTRRMRRELAGVAAELDDKMQHTLYACIWGEYGR